MEGGGWRGELDISFRQNVLHNVIKKALMECAQDAQDPNVLHKINDIVIKFEQRVFEKATSKDDYVTKIHERLNQAKSKFMDVLTPTAGNQLTISMIQRQVNQSCQDQRNFNRICFPIENHSILQNQPSFNGFPQDWQFGNQSAPIHNDFQQNMSMKDTYGSARYNMFGMDYRQRSVDNGLASQMAHMGSSSQFLQTFVNPQDRRNQFQAPGAFLSFPDYEGINTVDMQVLITQFVRMRSDYLPELIKFLDEVEVQNAHTQSIEQLQKSQRAKVVLGRMIAFLQMKQREIMAHSKDKLIYCMNQITQFIRRTIKTNNSKSTVGLNTPSFMDQGILNPQSSASNSYFYGSCNKTQQVNMQSLLYQSPRAATDCTHHKLKQNLQLNSSGMNQAYLEMLLPGNSLNSTQRKDDHSMLNPTSVAFQHNFVPRQFSRNPHPLPVKASQPPIHLDQENDTSSFSNLGGTSLPKTTSVFTLDSPSTPITPSFVSKEIEQPRNSSESIGNQEESAMQAEGSVAPEATTHLPLPLVENKPIERLIRAVAEMSQEALSSSIEGIESVICTLDRLSDPDMEHFPTYNPRAVECNKIKRDISSLSVDANNNTYLFTSPACKRLKIESKHDLADEIRKINQKLVETNVELASDTKNADSTKLEGTIVRCTYKAVVLSGRHFTPATTVSAGSVDLLVPLDYPNSPPRCLDTISPECRMDSEGLREKAMLRFNRSIRGFEESMSLEEMARAWNDCARKAVFECVGGESFSSKYGSWECVPAA